MDLLFCSEVNAPMGCIVHCVMTGGYLSWLGGELDFTVMDLGRDGG